MRLVFANRRLKFPNRLVPILRLRCHRLHGDFLELARRIVEQRLFRIRFANLVQSRSHQTLHRVLASVGRPRRYDFKQNRTQQINVTLWADLADRARRHFRSHVCWRSAHAGAGRDAFRLAEFVLHRVRQTPVHDEDFAEFTKHGVFRLQVTMNDTSGMSKRDGIRAAHQDVEIFRNRFVFDDVQPGCALDFLHRVKQRLILGRTDIVNRNDVRMIELAGHNRFRKELRSLIFVASRLRLEHLQGDVTVDRSLPRRKHDSHAAFAEHFDQFIFRFQWLGRTTTFVVVVDVLRAELPRCDHQRARS